MIKIKSNILHTLTRKLNEKKSKKLQNIFIVFCILYLKQMY